MLFLRTLLPCVAVLLVLPAWSASVTVNIDDSSARAVLDALQNPDLDLDHARLIAQLPGNQGLIRKARNYGRPASDELFARALVAAAHQDASYRDPSVFNFPEVRANAVRTQAVLADFANPDLHLLDKAKARIALFTPGTLSGKVTGYMVLGGTSGGFAFGEPAFYLNLQYFPSAVLAGTILQHELFHAVQGMAQEAQPMPASALACVARKSGGEQISKLFNALEMEGTATEVGDELSLPTTGADEPTTTERAEFAHNVGLAGIHVTQLELSVHALATGAALTFDEVYAADFYGNQDLYGLGYVMARAIAEQGGDQAIGALIAEPGSAFLLRYMRMRGYGKDLPKLGKETEEWTVQLSACSAQKQR